MKKYTYSLVAIALLISTVSITNAQSATDGQAPANTRTATGQSQPPRSTSVLQKIRTDLQNREQNLQTNQEVRKNQLEGSRAMSSTSILLTPNVGDLRNNIPAERRAIASTSREALRGVRISGFEDMKNASSSRERMDIRREMRKDIFMIEKTKITSQLEISIDNLVQIQNRIDSRIKKEQQNSKDVSSALSLFAIATTKINTAKTSLQALKDFKPVPVTTASSTNQAPDQAQNVNLDSIRQMIESTKAAIKDAHQALVNTVVAIAKISGTNTEGQMNNASSTTSNN